jgi:NTE family protein
LISPRVGQIGWFDFHRADELIAHGARAAERAIESIQEAIEILVSPSAKTSMDKTSMDKTSMDKAPIATENDKTVKE